MGNEPKDERMAELARRRWVGVPAEERQRIGRELTRARLAKLTPEQRSKIARHAALAKHYSPSTEREIIRWKAEQAQGGGRPAVAGKPT